MGTIKLRSVERELCRRVAHGDHFEVPDDSEPIRAKVLRHIVLRLPLIEADDTLLEQIWKVIKDVPDGRICGRTAVGLSIGNATIEGRLDLTSAREEGGAICPLTFVRSRFHGGFSGAEGHFSRLSFNGCTFSDAPSAQEEEEEPPPSPAAPAEAPPWPPLAPIDLSGALIESDLEMNGVTPQNGDSFFWIAAVGAKIHGRLLLNDGVLRVPRREGAPPAEAPPDALDLALAEVDGDLWFERGTSDSRVNGRSLRVRGDVWFSGADLASRDGHRTSLLLQGARIGGALLIQAWQPKGAGSAGKRPRRFVSHGEINLLACRVGVSLIIEDVDLHAGVRNCLNLSGVQVGNSIQMGGRVFANEPSTLRGRIVLTRAEVRNTIHIKQARFGNEPGDEAAVTIEGYPLTATHFLLRDVKPIEDRTFSLRLRDAQLERLETDEMELSGTFDGHSLDCRGEVVLQGTVGGAVELDDATIGGTLDLSLLRIGGENASLSLRDATIGRCLKLRRSLKDVGRPPFHLAGPADLRGATCGTLDDDLGRSWGMPTRILMNNFVYHRTGTPAQGGDPAECRKPSHRLVGDWLRGRRAEGRYPWRLLPRWLVAERNDFWDSWQLRRNWIFLQYDRARDDPYAVARRAIREQEYQPQPFEQAIRVARAEGRDSAATNFEILKQRIEWHHSNELMRWGLGILAITLAGFWLVVHDLRALPVAATVAATAVTIFLMINATRLYEFCRSVVRTRRRWLEKALLYLMFFAPAILILVHFWWDNPLRFLQAFMIFAAVRLLSNIAHAVMRFGFGYLRRPVYAIGTLITAFLIGWGAVAIANHQRMLIVDTAAIADHVREDGQLGSPVGAAVRMNLHCGKTIKEPLYALDILIPLLDLREESRCKVGRVETPPQPRVGNSSGTAPEPGSGFGGLIEAWRALTVQNEFFWAVAKAIYAIAGWFLVSLAILTFANIHRTPAEPK